MCNQLWRSSPSSFHPYSSVAIYSFVGLGDSHNRGHRHHLHTLVSRDHEWYNSEREGRIPKLTMFDPAHTCFLSVLAVGFIDNCGSMVVSAPKYRQAGYQKRHDSDLILEKSENATEIDAAQFVSQ